MNQIQPHSTFNGPPSAWHPDRPRRPLPARALDAVLLLAVWFVLVAWRVGVALWRIGR